MLLLDGKLVSNAVRDSLVPTVQDFQKQAARPPHLVVVIVGDDPASHVYVKNKHLACQKVGIQSTILSLPENTQQEDLNKVIDRLNEDDAVDGVLVQLPLPKQLSKDQVLRRLSVDKDVDGFTYESLGNFYAGHTVVSPCTPAGIMKIFEHYQIPVQGKHVVVVGRSNIVGKPMATMLTEANATVTVCHSKTKNMQEFTRIADIVVIAVGKARMFGKEDFKKDAVIIDVGMHGTGAGKLCGDVRTEELEGWAHAITPVPGGVGPMTIAMLLDNTCKLAMRRLAFWKK